jgi:sarcosine oxidase subunit beta
VPAAILVADPDLPALREVIGAGKAAGIDLREMPPADFAACEPTAALTNIAGVAYTPQAGYVDPTSTAWSLGGAAQALGVGISTGLPESQAVEIVHDGHKVSGVRTAGDTHYHTRTVVLAAGLDTGRWLQQLGLTDPLREVNQQVGVVKPPPGAARPQHLIVDLPNRMYSRPEANTLTLLSGVHTGMHTPQRGSPPATGDEAAQRYYAGAGARFPALSGAAPVRAWAGVIDQTPDSAPLLGMLPLDGLYVAAGLGAWGVSLAPSIGQLVAGMIVDDYQAIERLIQLRYSRFDEGMALHPQARFAEHSPDSI